MSLTKFTDRLKQLECSVKLENGKYFIGIEEPDCELIVSDDWVKAIKSYYRAIQYKFDQSNRVLLANRSVEFSVVRIDPGYFYKAEVEFEDDKGNEVTLSPATKEFFLAYFESELYGDSFPRIRDRMNRKINRLLPNGRPRRGKPRLRIEELFFNLHTIQFRPKRINKSENLTEIAAQRVRACLFSLAYQRNEVWELRQDIKARGSLYTPPSEDEEKLQIPKANYDPSMVNHYKVARSSQFPSQVFLSYYHVLEYHFLRVADETLMRAVKTQLNDISFRSDYENINKLVSVVKKNDHSTDEKNMLKAVLNKYVSEQEFIEFVKSVESEAGERLFSDPKQPPVFGERIGFKLDAGHALSNAANAIKHVRNALVHSSDRYTREDCYLPFTESEDLVAKYVPLVKYLAERVIFATAEQ